MARVLKCKRYLSLSQKAAIYEDFIAQIPIKEIIKRHKTTHSTVQTALQKFMPFIDKENSITIVLQSKINKNE